MSEPSKPRSSRVVPAIALLLVGGGITLALLRTPSLHEDPFANAPEGTVALARVDVAAVLNSSLWAKLVTERGGDRGLQRLREQCGVDPAAQVRHLTGLVMGDARTLDHVVFLAEGPFDHEALGDCMRTVVEAEGGGIREAEVEGLPAVAGAQGDSRIAFLGREGAILGSEAAVARVVRTVRGEEASIAESGLRMLWERVASERDIGVVAQVPPHWREVVTARVEPEARDIASIFVTDLQRIGVGARVRRGLSIGAVLVYASSERAEIAGEWLQERKAELMDSTLVTLSPAGPALRAVAIEVRGAELVVAVDLSQERVNRLFELAAQLQEDQTALPLN
ncbi:MAG: hypothetical protein AAGE52_22405 [Myxococcota bacterium]